MTVVTVKRVGMGRQATVSPLCHKIEEFTTKFAKRCLRKLSYPLPQNTVEQNHNPNHNPNHRDHRDHREHREHREQTSHFLCATARDHHLRF